MGSGSPPRFRPLGARAAQIPVVGPSYLRARRQAQRVADRIGTRLLAPPRSAFGASRLHGPRGERRVALTFDDGPSRGSTERLLDVLDEHDVCATFFVVGERVLDAPAILRRAVEAGHQVGNHTMHHRRRDTVLGRAISHITDAETAIADVIGQRPLCYRPPWGWLTPWEAQRARQRGLQLIGWDVYTHDWTEPETSASVIVDEITSSVLPGSIVLLHDVRPNLATCDKRETARAVGRVIPALRDVGYTFVTVAELLDIAPYEPTDRRTTSTLAPADAR